MSTKPVLASWILALAVAGSLLVALRPGHAQTSPADRAIAERLVHSDPFLALAPGADLVVVASPTSRRSYWSADHRLILTDYRLAIAGALRGSPPAAIGLTVEGGEVGEVGLAVSAAPRFEPGARYALLLEREGAGFRVRSGVLGERRLATGVLATDPDLQALDFVLKSGVLR